MRHRHLREHGSVCTGLDPTNSGRGPGRDGLSREAADLRFAGDALPLREELLRIARRYAPNVHDAEDLVQETYVKAWLAFESCTPGSNLRAWMLRIMVNTWIDNHRKTQRRPKEVLAGSVTDEDLIADRPRRSLSPSAEETALGNVPNDQLRQGIHSLPAALQTALFYADVCQFPVRQIAEIECIPMGTVMSRLYRARRRLRSTLSEAGAPGPGGVIRGDSGTRSPKLCTTSV